MQGESRDEASSCAINQAANPFPTEGETATCCSSPCESMGAMTPEEVPDCREAGAVAEACVKAFIVKEEDTCPGGGEKFVGPTG